MIQRVKEFLQSNNIKNRRIVVGLSGGPDSVSLLYLLNSVKEECQLALEAAYVNHGLRSEKENSRDFELVKCHCSNLNIKLHVYNVPQGEISSKAKISKRSSEAIAREIRYNFFDSLVYNKGLIAIGHNYDDQIETILMRLFQGSSIEGLIGIKEVNGNIIRPLYSIEKNEILKYLTENEIKYNIDHTNNENDYLRNKVRNKLIPAISDIFPGYKSGLSRVEEEINFAADLIKEQYPELPWKERKYGDFLVKLEQFHLLPYKIRKREIFNLYDKVFKNKIKDFRLPDRFLVPLKSITFPKNKTILDGYGCRLFTTESELVFSKLKEKRSFSINVLKNGIFSNSKNRIIVSTELLESGSLLNMDFPFVVRSVVNGYKENKILKKIGINKSSYYKVIIIEHNTKIVAIFYGNEIVYNRYSGKKAIYIKVEEKVCLEL